ncbi:unnamed protein product [Amoebophrya sp. A120]|nr:unnamed protein product [Amoebophrya sp. A120]|eukprot:GSA120T00018991001.1
MPSLFGAGDNLQGCAHLFEKPFSSGCSDVDGYHVCVSIDAGRGRAAPAAPASTFGFGHGQSQKHALYSAFLESDPTTPTSSCKTRASSGTTRPHTAVFAADHAASGVLGAKSTGRNNCKNLATTSLNSTAAVCSSPTRNRGPMFFSSPGRQRSSSFLDRPRRPNSAAGQHREQVPAKFGYAKNRKKPMYSPNIMSDKYLQLQLQKLNQKEAETKHAAAAKNGAGVGAGAAASSVGKSSHDLSSSSIKLPSGEISTTAANKRGRNYRGHDLPEPRAHEDEDEINRPHNKNKPQPGPAPGGSSPSHNTAFPWFWMSSSEKAAKRRRKIQAKEDVIRTATQDFRAKRCFLAKLKDFDKTLRRKVPYDIAKMVEQQYQIDCREEFPVDVWPDDPDGRVAECKTRALQRLENKSKWIPFPTASATYRKLDQCEYRVQPTSWETFKQKMSWNKYLFKDTVRRKIEELKKLPRKVKDATSRAMMSTRDFLISKTKQAGRGALDFTKKQLARTGSAIKAGASAAYAGSKARALKVAKEGKKTLDAMVTGLEETGTAKKESLPPDDIAVLTMAPRTSHTDHFLTFDRMVGQGPMGLRGYHQYFAEPVHQGKDTGIFL